MKNHIQVQAIVMTRTLTDVVDSQQLKDLFLATLNDSNPSGYDKISVHQLEEHVTGQLILELLRRPFRQVLTDIAMKRLYRPISNISQKQARALYDSATIVDLLNMIRTEFKQTNRRIEAGDSLGFLSKTFAQGLPRLCQLICISPNFQWEQIDVGSRENATN